MRGVHRGTVAELVAAAAAAGRTAGSNQAASTELMPRPGVSHDVFIT